MRASNALIRASTFWGFCEWEEDEDVNESMETIARAAPTNFNLIDLISIPFDSPSLRSNWMFRVLSYLGPQINPCPKST